jgi:hypothetical protein
MSDDITNNTGKFLRLMADIEHEYDQGVTIEHKDGRWVVGGVAVVDSIESALELALGAAA